MNFDLEYWRGFQDKGSSYNVAKEQLYPYLDARIDEIRGDIILKVTSYITKIPYKTLKNNKVKLKNIKTKTVMQSRHTLDGRVECWIHNGKILAEMFVSIEEIHYAIKPCLHWEDDK